MLENCESTQTNCQRSGESERDIHKHIYTKSGRQSLYDVIIFLFVFNVLENRLRFYREKAFRLHFKKSVCFLHLSQRAAGAPERKNEKSKFYTYTIIPVLSESAVENEIIIWFMAPNA